MLMTWYRQRRGGRDDGGAIAIIVALSMMALLVGAALVVNLGLARVDRVTNKTYTDAAAEAGIAATGSARYPYAGACIALAYLRANDPELKNMTTSWQTGAETAVTGDPCATGSALLTAVCVPNTTSSYAWFTGTSTNGRITAEIKSGYHMPDPKFPSDGAADNSASDCDQLAVIITEREKTGLGNAANDPNTPKDITTMVRSVGRATVVPGDSAAALVLLEQHSCDSLRVDGGGTIAAWVYGSGAAAGSIHTDSLADACTGDVRSRATLYAPDWSNSFIKAFPAETGGAPGTITSAALSGAPGANPANAANPKLGVVCAQGATSCGPVTGSPVVGRAPVDNRYLVGARNAIGAAAAQYTKGSSPGSTAGGVPYTVLGCNLNASNNAVAVFVNCPGGAIVGGADKITFPNATDFVVNGSLQIGSGGALTLPNVVRLYVKGAAGGNGMTVNGAAWLDLNTGAPTTTCAARAAAPAAQIVVGNGSFNVTAGNGDPKVSNHLCNTTVLMADGSGFNGSGTGCLLPTPPDVGTGPAPLDNSCKGFINVSGAQKLDWTAPNHVTGAAGAGDWANLEDLAFWTETSGSNTIAGSGNIQVTGVFFLPNANSVSITGDGSTAVIERAQFVARKLLINGSSKLMLRPIPTDSVPFSQSTAFGLVR